MLINNKFNRTEPAGFADFSNILISDTRTIGKDTEEERKEGQEIPPFLANSCIPQYFPLNISSNI